MDELFKNRLERNLQCKLIIIDNFYENPMEVREFALQQEYIKHDYHPGIRTKKQFITDEHYKKIKQYIKPFGYKNVKSNSSDTGTFQINTQEDVSWIHRDNYTNNENNIWAGIIYLTPNAPVSSGTGFYTFKENSCMDYHDLEFLNNEDEIKKYCRDKTKWELSSSVGNIFNRLVLFHSNQYHISLDYFGNDKNNARLIQLFFLEFEE